MGVSVLVRVGVLYTIIDDKMQKTHNFCTLVLELRLFCINSLRLSDVCLHQDNVWTSAGILLMGPLGTNFSEILIEIHTFSFKKMHLKMSSGKWWLFSLILNVLSHQYIIITTGLYSILNTSFTGSAFGINDFIILYWLHTLPMIFSDVNKLKRWTGFTTWQYVKLTLPNVRVVLDLCIKDVCTGLRSAWPRYLRTGERFKNTYELLNLRALKFSPVNKIHIFQCIGKMFCEEFQRFPLKFHTK